MMMKKIDVPAIEGGKPVREDFLVFGKPDFGRDEINEVVDSIKKAWIGTGPKVAKFERLIGGYVGARYSLALNSCTAGMHLSLLACGVGRGDEVITSPMTFASTANVIEHVGAKPVFADINKETFNIDPEQIKKKISKKTKAIIPVHMAGRPCDMDAITQIAKDHNLVVIEDAAHAFGAEYHGKMIGNISPLTAFSFYATKNLVTGEGGLITTNNEQYAEFIKVNALHGMSKDAWKRYSDEGFKHYLIEYPGYKYNMMDLQAAIGIPQFYRFDKNQRKRAKLWKKYRKELDGLPLTLPAEPEPKTKHAYHLFQILVDINKLKASRDEIQAALHAENIGLGIHFIALHLHPFYQKKYGYKRGDFPNSEYVSDRTISIPFGSYLTASDADSVIAGIKKVLNYYLANKTSKKTKIKLPQAVKDVNGKK